MTDHPEREGCGNCRHCTVGRPVLCNGVTTQRWFMFDGLKNYAPPVTIFGPKRAALYIGNMYLVLNSTEHIRELTRAFDQLIRAAVIQPPNVATLISGLLSEVESGAEVRT